MYLEIYKSKAKYKILRRTLQAVFNVIMFANDLIKPTGKEVTGITLVPGFLSKGDKISNGFCWCEKIRRDEQCLSCYLVHFKTFCL